MQVQLFSMANQRSECLKLTKNRGKKTAVTVQSSDSARAADELNETNNSSSCGCSITKSTKFTAERRCINSVYMYRLSWTICSNNCWRTPRRCSASAPADVLHIAQLNNSSSWRRSFMKLTKSAAQRRSIHSIYRTS